LIGLVPTGRRSINLFEQGNNFGQAEGEKTIPASKTNAKTIKDDIEQWP
jgi:hypothetical protein